MSPLRSLMALNGPPRPWPTARYVHATEPCVMLYGTASPTKRRRRDRRAAGIWTPFAPCGGNAHLGHRPGGVCGRRGAVIVRARRVDVVTHPAQRADRYRPANCSHHAGVAGIGIHRQRRADMGHHLLPKSCWTDLRTGRYRTRPPPLASEAWAPRPGPFGGQDLRGPDGRHHQRAQHGGTGWLSRRTLSAGWGER